MKKTAFILCLLIAVSSVTAFLGTDYIIKFDDEKSGIIIDEDGYGCGTDGKIFFQFMPEETINIPNIQLTYDEDKPLEGKYYKRDKLGFFKEKTDKVVKEEEYYFFSNTIKESGTHTVELNNLKVSFLREFEVKCPKFRYTCDDFKPKVDTCYNTENGKLIIEFSGVGSGAISVSDLFIHTKGNNNFVDEADNVLSDDARIEKIGDKYRITSTTLVGDPKKGDNIIETVYFQPKACFLDLYSDAYTYKDCYGVKKEVSEDNDVPAVTGSAVGVSSSGSWKYWILALFVVLLVVVLYVKRK